MTIFEDMVAMPDEELIDKVETLQVRYNDLNVEATDALGEILIALTVLVHRAVEKTGDKHVTASNQ